MMRTGRSNASAGPAAVDPRLPPLDEARCRQRAGYRVAGRVRNRTRADNRETGI